MADLDICINIWISDQLDRKATEDIAMQDLKVATAYWNVNFDISFYTIKEVPPVVYNIEDIVRSRELDTVQGYKLVFLFMNSLGISPCWDDPMTAEDSRRTLHVFYLNVTKLASNNPNVKGRTYYYRGHLFIIMALRNTTIDNPFNIYNIFAHELGHALFLSNKRLNGMDPISNKEHNLDPRNLMYEEVPDGENRILVQEQLDAVENSFLTNRHILHDNM
ncbi:hypothetical protein CN331_04925 [Bacillus cereus]|uniref:hypothetical protein n=1 Tax=Bacillus cereus TaxID=1396 RepID=UPI000BF641AF|nr:hypothetical protein [Bacillus cereus]PEW64650.1 hypothetical protein CN443_03130 [Bacillus cereus]PEY23802.1 hypothetical protein CN331_04925 [Bacillus cereus]